MTIFFPDNLFTRLLTDVIDKEDSKEILFIPSSILFKKLNEHPNSAALIPALELITNKDLFVSKSVGISFEGPLSNSFIYYKPGPSSKCYFSVCSLSDRYLCIGG